MARDWVEVLAPLTCTPVFDDHLRDAENPQHPSYFDATSGYEMIVFRGLLSTAPLIDESGALRVRTRPTVFFAFARCLVTVRARDSQLVPAMHARLLALPQSGTRQPASPEELMLRLLNAMVDRYLDQRQPLADRLERLQRQLLDPRRPFRDWPTLLDARSELRRLELLCEEQLGALERWREQRLERDPTDETAGTEPGLPPLSESAQVRANDVVEHIHRVVKHAKGLEHSIETAVQLHFSSTAHRTNEIMRTLTTITAIFMPLSLITGIFGMNFEFIPGLHSRGGFWIAMAAMVVIAIALLVYFRARRYLNDPSSMRRPSRGSAAARRQRPP
ncbi:MAG: magnesium transporter CorA family protein [Burkholderiaceae bacterium]|nr:magnesium transporter CorA family protein [Burkholderiaceae bacterium]